GTRLVAYVRFRDTPSPASDLRAYLQARLPDYMVPSLFVPVKEFPLTPNGKVDRAALPDPERAGSAAGGVSEAPRSEVEALVASLWAEVLQVPRVGVHENFFELGGHSLLATRAISRIRDSFGVELPLRALFEAPTVAGLAERIESARRAADGIATAPLRKAEPRERYPLSFQQQRLWFVQQLEPAASHYNVQRALRLSGPLHVESLGRAVNEIVRRHESLRTIFVSEEGEASARVLPDFPITLREEEAEDVPAEAREERMLEIAREEARTAFDLSREAPLRVRFARLGSEDHALILTLHHIVCDAWSLGVLIRELSTLYDAFSQGRESPLPELPIQYPDYAVWQRQLLTGEVLARLVSYWRGVLGSDRTPLALKTDRPRPAVQTFQGARHPQRLPGDLTERLKAVSREEGATLFMTLLAGFQALLSRETGQSKIVVGTDIANRSRSETEPMIGFFVNLLVLSTDVSGNPAFRELLGRVRESALGAYAHQDLPFEKLVEELRPDRDLSRNPLVQVLFVMQNIPRAAVRSPGLVLSGLDVGTDVARFDLAVFINETGEGFLANWVYNTDLFDRSTIRGMAERYQRLLQSAGEGPDTRLENLEMMSEAEKQRLADAKAERREAQSHRLKSMRRKGVDLAKMEDVKVGELTPGQACPLVVQPAGESMDLAEWAARERPFLEASLLKHGAILFRGFGVKSADEFERFASGLCPELFGEYGDLPREAVGGKVYGSTPYPSDQAILFHNESSHMHRWPMKIFFYCVLPAQSGGETPIVDCRLVYQRLDPKLRERFAEKGLLYLRNYTERLDVSWQSFYGTEDRAQVEAACRRAGTEFEWTSGNGLRTRQRCPAVIRHPQTGEMSFFNQLQLHHVSCLDPAVRESLSSILREEDLPRNVYYGDGSRIEDSVMEEVGGVYRETSVAFPWQAGDVIMLNNMMTAHARNPYVGPRKIVVAMGEMIQMNEAAG
ncbi:MAG: condensation domain-containing protein, partial [Thermoanaerobaculia bacterium]